MGRATTLLVCAFALAGCDGESSEDTLLRIHVAHHGTPSSGAFETGSDGTKTFTSDRDWEIELAEGTLVFGQLALTPCATGDLEGAAIELPLDVAVDLTTEDLSVTLAAAQPVDAGSYCEMSIEFGDGSSGAVVLEGVASMDGETYDYRYDSPKTRAVKLPLGSMGGTLELGEGEFDLTVSAAYDRLFDCTDFTILSDTDVAEFEGQVLGMLAEETHLTMGPQPAPY